MTEPNHCRSFFQNGSLAPTVESVTAIYCRLSEEDRDKKHKTDESGSIQNQKAMLLAYAAEQGWEVYGIYSDGVMDGQTGICCMLDPDRVNNTQK